jgi:hypothetical protein
VYPGHDDLPCSGCLGETLANFIAPVTLPTCAGAFRARRDFDGAARCQHALKVLGHDGTHYTLSGNARLNDILTNLVCFLPLGLTVSGYRALHYAHHQHTGTEHDPELRNKRMRSPQWDLPADRWKLLSYALADLVGGSLQDYLIIVRFAKPAMKA